MSLEQLRTKRNDAREGLTKTEQAITRGQAKAAELEVEIEGLESSLADLQSAILLGDASEDAGNAAVEALAVTTKKLTAVKSGLDGMSRRLASDQQALEQAKVELAQAAINASRPIIAALQTDIQRSLGATMASHANLLRLLKGLSNFGEGKVSAPLDYDSWSVQCFDERLHDACRANGLQRVRQNVDAFCLEPGRSAPLESELLALLSQ